MAATDSWLAAVLPYQLDAKAAIGLAEAAAAEFMAPNGDTACRLGCLVAELDEDEEEAPLFFSLLDLLLFLDALTDVRSMGSVCLALCFLAAAGGSYMLE